MALIAETHLIASGQTDYRYTICSLAGEGDSAGVSSGAWECWGRAVWWIMSIFVCNLSVLYPVDKGRAELAKYIANKEYLFMGAPKGKPSSTLRYSRLLSFISITVTLFMLGALGLVYALEQGLSHQVRERISLSIELPSEDAGATAATVAELKRLPYVRQVDVISPDSAARSLAAVLGEDPTEVLGYNPLVPMARLYLRADYTHPDSIRQIVQSNPLLHSATGLDEQEGQWAAAVANLQTIRLVLWIFVGLHLLVSFLQINTATGLVIYSQRMRIRTLSLIGATSGFISRPFIRRAVLESLFGAVVALVLLSAGVYALELNLGYSFLALCPVPQLIGVLVAVPAVGVIVSFLSSLRATRRYIHMDEAKIQLI